MIEDIIQAYKQIDLEIIKSIEEDREDYSLLEKREGLIKSILEDFDDKEKVKRLYIENELKELDYKLQKILNDKIRSVKNNIKKLAVGKEANRSYNSVNRKINFFSTNV